MIIVGMAIELSDYSPKLPERDEVGWSLDLASMMIGIVLPAVEDRRNATWSHVERNFRSTPPAVRTPRRQQ
jgi:hypothetical protein